MQGELERYNDIIQTRLSQGIVERAEEVVRTEESSTFLISPFLLAAVIKAHLHRYKMVNPELVDDLISGGETIKQTLEIKMTATAILGEATFKLHKWNSNNQKLEVETATSDEESQSYAKRQVETRKGESKLLWVPWDKEKDETKVSFPISTAEPTKGASLENSQKSTIHSVWLHPWPSLWRTIPRLELVAGRMAANLVQNVKEVLKGFPVRSVYGWLGSTVALDWNRGNGDTNSSWEIEWGRSKKNKSTGGMYQQRRIQRTWGVGEEMLVDWQVFGGKDQAG